MATGDIPIARGHLENIIKRIRQRQPKLAAELDEEVLRRMYRDQWKKRKARATRNSVDKLTEDQRAEIKELADQGVSNRDIGRMFNVDGGRVSEVLGSKPG